MTAPRRASATLLARLCPAVLDGDGSLRGDMVETGGCTGWTKPVGAGMWPGGRETTGGMRWSCTLAVVCVCVRVGVWVCLVSRGRGRGVDVVSVSVSVSVQGRAGRRAVSNKARSWS